MHIKILGATVNAAVLAYHFAESGHKVLWKPYDEQLKSQILQKEILFDDYQLGYLIDQQILDGRLFIDCCESDERSYTVCVIAVNNMQFYNFEQFADQFRLTYQLIVNYSNLGLGATKNIQNLIHSRNIIYIPDFIQDGQYIQSFITKALIVGCDNDELVSMVKELFRPLFPLSKHLNFMSILAAEFTKLSISGFLATKVSFMNDLSNVTESLGIDIEEIRIAMSMDDRIGEQYLYPGCGFGGNNFTRDILKLKEVVLDTGNVNGLLDKIWDINENQKEVVFRKLWKLFNCELKDKVIAIWGGAFKPNVGSIANAPILKVLEACWAQGAMTQVHDPRALTMLRERYPDQQLLKLYDDQYAVTDGADVLCLLTEWKQYWSPDYQLLGKMMRQKNIVDGRNIYNPIYVENQGFTYIGIGR